MTGIIKVCHLCDDICGVQHQGASSLWLFIIFEHGIWKNSNCLRLKNGLYKSCRSQSDQQLCSWKFFQLRLFWYPNTWFKFWISNFQMTSWKKVYMKVVGRDQFYNFVVENIFIWDRYSCEMDYIRYFKVITKGKYLIVGHMWWCSPVVGEGTREAEVVGLNPSNVEKNRTRTYSCGKSRDLRCEHGRKKKIFS